MTQSRTHLRSPYRVAGRFDPWVNGLAEEIISIETEFAIDDVERERGNVFNAKDVLSMESGVALQVYARLLNDEDIRADATETRMISQKSYVRIKQCIAEEVAIAISKLPRTQPYSSLLERLGSFLKGRMKKPVRPQSLAAMGGMEDNFRCIEGASSLYSSRS